MSALFLCLGDPSEALVVGHHQRAINIPVPARLGDQRRGLVVGEPVVQADVEDDQLGALLLPYTYLTFVR